MPESPIITFGRHKGERFNQVPLTYRRWIIDQVTAPDAFPRVRDFAKSLSEEDIRAVMDSFEKTKPLGKRGERLTLALKCLGCKHKMNNFGGKFVSECIDPSGNIVMVNNTRTGMVTGALYRVAATINWIDTERNITYVNRVKVQEAKGDEMYA